MYRKNKKGYSLIELSVFIAIVPLIIGSVGFIATKAYELYNGYNIRQYVLSENVKFNKALGGIRFAKAVSFVDESPANHPDISQISFEAPKGQTIAFNPIDLGTDTNDIQFLSDGNEIYTYNQDYIDFEKFKVTVLDNTINRRSIKIDVIMGVDGETNQVARSKFGRKKYQLEYTTTLTFRNDADSDG